MNRTQAVALRNLQAVKEQAEWRVIFERCVRACGAIPTENLWARAMPLYQAGSTPHSAVADLGIVA